MSMTDPIADLLTRIRNGQMARHRTVKVPASRIKVEIVRILKDEGFVEDFGVSQDSTQGTIEIDLKYSEAGEPAISGLERVSRAGRRVYCSRSEIPSVLNGLGLTLVSTSQGLMTGSACRRAGLGGEVLCSVW
jgi:small subunit ribosomal protein S8